MKRRARRHAKRSALAGALVVAGALACNQRFDFDVPHAEGGAGAGASAGAPSGGVAGMGGRVECFEDADCGLSLLHCDTTSRLCVECLGHAHCGASGRPRCDAAMHRCVQCGLDLDCGDGQACEPGPAPISRRAPACCPPRSAARCSNAERDGSLASCGNPRPIYRLVMRIQSVHHIGIRVTDERRAVDFYARFGFAVTYRDAHDPVVILQNDAGVELNLVVNADASFDGKNRLMDVPQKFPGYTHVALRVSSLAEAEESLKSWGIRITEGPKRLGPGVSLFVRDPDANVIELRQDVA